MHFQFIFNPFRLLLLLSLHFTVDAEKIRQLSPSPRDNTIERATVLLLKFSLCIDD